METWHPDLATFFIGYRFGWGLGVGKNKHNFYVVNVNKTQLKQIKIVCFDEAFLHFHNSKILLDLIKVYNCFSIEWQRINEIKQSQRITEGMMRIIVTSWQGF